MLEQELVAIDRIHDKDKLTIDWFFGKRCNYDCSYCTPDIHDKTSPHLEYSQLQKISESIFKSNQPKDIKITFTGGEPTLNPDFGRFCKDLAEKGVHKMTLTTNGSQTAQYYIDLYDSLSNMTFSLHFEFVKVPYFLKKIDQINTEIKKKEKFKFLIVQVMFHADYFEEAKQAVEFLREKGINFTLRRIRGKETESRHALNYSEEQLEWFFANQPKSESTTNTRIYTQEESGIVQFHDIDVNEISAAQKNNFNGWTCWAGVQHLHIWVDGSIYRGNCHQGGVIGKVGDSDFHVPIQPVICEKTRCFCSAEISLKKIVNLDELSKVNKLGSSPFLKTAEVNMTGEVSSI